VLIPLSGSYPPVTGRLHTRYSPVRRSPPSEDVLPLDLHVLGLSLAFILSQDQTLRCIKVFKCFSCAYSKKFLRRYYLNLPLSFLVLHQYFQRTFSVLVLSSRPYFMPFRLIIQISCDLFFKSECKDMCLFFYFQIFCQKSFDKFYLIFFYSKLNLTVLLKLS
jgi:hypothetical protein